MQIHYLRYITGTVSNIDMCTMTSLPSDRARPIWGGQISHACNEAGRNKCVFINGKGAINHVLWAPVTVVMKSFQNLPLKHFVGCVNSDWTI